MKKIFNKFLYSFILFIILFNFCGGVISRAAEIQSADLFYVDRADYHLKYYREDTDSYRYLICSIVGYNENNVFYPAYCVNKELQGVTDEFNYSVNVKDVISRDDVWRAVKNGYPYKSCEELGLENDWDAFAVTKFAIYCIIGQSDLSKFYAEPDDDEAIRMLQVLTDLVNIGINGNETRTSGNFTISKLGDFEEEGNYYFQQYKINSDIEMKDVNIELNAGLPNGSYISKIDNLSFRVFVPKEKVEGCVNGKIRIYGKSKIYPLFYGDSENPETQDYILTYDTFGNVSSICDVNFQIDKGQIKVIKVDKDNNEIKLKDVKFNILDEAGNVLETIITNENGEAFSSKYLIKKYKNLNVQEVETNNKYKLSEQNQKIQLKPNEVTTIVFENEKKKGKVEVIKVDKDNTEIKIEGVKFGIYDIENNLIQTLITNENGEALSEDLDISKEYYVKELENGDEYMLNDEPVRIELKEDEITTIKFENEKIKNKVKIVKSEKGNKDKKLEGVKFELLDEESNVLEILVTDKNGEAFSKYYPVVNKVYTLHEIETLDGYKKQEEYTCFELDKNEIIEIDFENEKIPEEIDYPKEEVKEEKVEKIEYKEIKQEIVKQEETVIEIPEEKAEIKVLPRTGY